MKMPTVPLALSVLSLLLHTTQADSHLESLTDSLGIHPEKTFSLHVPKADTYDYIQGLRLARILETDHEIDITVDGLINNDEWKESSVLLDARENSSLLHSPDSRPLARKYQSHRRRLQLAFPHRQQDDECENEFLSTKLSRTKLFKTGTTIAGVCGRDFCVLGADTRATAGRLVADKRAEKIHRLAANVFACGAGTSADLDQITQQCYYSLRLQNQLEQESVGNSAKSLEAVSIHTSSVQAACRFLQDILLEEEGGCQANLIVGGVWQGKAVLRALHPHGSQDALSFTALGSGGLAAMAVLESRHRAEITVEEAVQLVKDAIIAGIDNDLGSGSQVDLCIINTDGTANYTRCAVPEEELAERKQRKFSRSSEESLPGVNGFGNLPFAVKSERLVVVSREQEVLDDSKHWNELLGL